MADVVDFIPIFQETLDRIRARVFADANSGLSPDDPAFLDTSPGGFFYDITGATMLEIDRLWDAIGAEMVAAMLPGYAWGTYLDEHGLTVGLLRKDAVSAQGVVTFTGTVGQFIGTGAQVQTPQPSPDSDPIVYATTAPATVGGGGTVDVPVVAVLAGTAGNVPSATVTIVASPLTGITSVTNAAAMTGGADVESDEAFRDRILVAYQGSLGSGTVSDYIGWALAYPGVGHAQVEPLWAGAGTVRVTVTDAQNHPVPGGIVTGLQLELDPVAGEGRGLAPIGATVTVATPTTVTANIAAGISPRTGYTLDGTSGTIAIRADLAQAVTDYLNSLAAGEDVIVTHVIAALFQNPGVLDVPYAGVLINTVNANLAISATQIATPGSVTLT